MEDYNGLKSRAEILVERMGCRQRALTGGEPRRDRWNMLVDVFLNSLNMTDVAMIQEELSSDFRMVGRMATAGAPRGPKHHHSSCGSKRPKTPSLELRPLQQKSEELFRLL